MRSILYRKWLPNIRKLSQGRTSEKSSDATARNLPAVNRESSKPNFKVQNYFRIWTSRKIFCETCCTLNNSTIAIPTTFWIMKCFKLTINLSWVDSKQIRNSHNNLNPDIQHTLGITLRKFKSPINPNSIWLWIADMLFWWQNFKEIGKFRKI